MSENQQNLCFSVTIHKLTGYLRFTVYPQQHSKISNEKSPFLGFSIAFLQNLVPHFSRKN